MIVTFDTNILVSGFTRPEGRASQAMVNITLRNDDLFISQPIIEELLRVLDNKFNWSAAALDAVSGWIARNCQVVAPVETLSVLADEPDNRILECAAAANADLIVTVRPADVGPRQFPPHPHRDPRRLSGDASVIRSQVADRSTNPRGYHANSFSLPVDAALLT